MSYFMNKWKTLILLLVTGGTAFGQATPTASVTGPIYNPGVNLPLIDGNFQYSLSASEIVQFGYSGQSGHTETTALSGTAEYLSRNNLRPFTLLYSGGLLYSTYASQGASTFQTLGVSQGLVHGRWSFGVADNVSYLPQAPTTGLSGVPGVGDLIFQPISDPSLSSQSILTNYGPQVSNNLSGNIERKLNGRTSISGSGNYGIMKFLNGNGLSNQSISGQVSLNRIIDRRSSMSLTGMYSTSSYTGNSSSFNSRGINAGYNRQLSKTVSINLSAGPQWISSFTAPVLISGGPAVVKVPSRLSLATNLGISYTMKQINASLGYSRGVNNGSGVQVGSVADSLSAQASRAFGRDWTGSVSAAYSHTTGLVQNGTTTTFFSGSQVSRRISRSFSAYASYTAIKQSIASSQVLPNAFNGFSQSVGVGITFSPRSGRVNRF